MEAPRPESPRPPGIIDALGNGFALLNRRLLILLLPIGFDLFLWGGPILSVASLLPRAEALQPPEGAPVDPVVRLALLFGVFLRLAGAPVIGPNGNLLDLMSLQMPSFTMDVAPSALTARLVWELESWALVAALGLAFFVLGLIASAFYLEVLAQAVRGEEGRGQPWPSLLVRRSGSLAGFLALWVVLFALLLGLVWAVSRVLGDGPLLFLLLIPIQGFAFYASLSFVFKNGPIFVEGHGPLAAAKASLRFVWRRFWPCLGFFALVVLIRSGMQIGLRQFFGEGMSVSLWIVPAMVFYGYVVSGLTTGTLVFYQNNLAALAAVRQPRRMRTR